jgi:hypothetical protein
MTTLPEYRWPRDFYPNSVQLDCQPYTITSRMPLRGSRRSSGPIVEVWEARLTYRDLIGAENWGPIRGFLGRVRGAGGLIRIHDQARALPRGTAAGVASSTKLETITAQPWSDGSYFSDGTGWTDAATAGVIATAAPAKSEWILISGLVPSMPLSIGAADLMEIGGRLYESLIDVPSDPSGRALVQIGPRLRAPVLPGDRVEFAYATTPMQFVDKRPVMEVRGGGNRTDFGLDLVEWLG